MSYYLQTPAAVQVSYLLPDVVMGEEAAQFTLGERSAVIRVLVSRQHLNPQSLHIGLIQSSERRGDKQRLKMETINHRDEARVCFGVSQKRHQDVLTLSKVP